MLKMNFKALYDTTCNVSDYLNTGLHKVDSYKIFSSPNYQSSYR